MPKKDPSGITKMVDIGSIIHKPKHVLMTSLRHGKLYLQNFME